jgi:primase-polymerase (primpol)-like protein
MINASNGINHRPPRPEALTVQPDYIPAELRALPQWVNWKYEYQPERNPKKPWTKPPFQTNGYHAKSNDPDTWVSFEEAWHHVRGFDGLGFTPTEQDPYTLVDLDDCRDPQTGAIAQRAQQIIQTLDSYTELSPSGTGIRIIVRGKLPAQGRKKNDIEIYDTGHYLTLTGYHLEGTPLEIHERQAEIEAIHAEVFGPQSQPQGNRNSKGPSGGTSAGLSDGEVLHKAFAAKNGERISRLYLLGDISNYNGDDSAADLALCDFLAFYTGPDLAQLDRLFRGSKLFRPEKWDVKHYADGHTYGQGTMDKALEGATEFYHTGRPNSNGSEPSAGSPDTEEADWPAREPLPEKLAAPTLPAEMIPEAYRQWALDVARQACFPPVMVVVPALVATSTVIGRKLGIRPWRFDNYTFPPICGALSSLARPA